MKQGKYVIGGEHFSTKKAVTERIRSILKECDFGEIEGQDGRFAKAFFGLHPNVQKATNIAEVHISRHRMGHREFVIEKEDGEMVVASYHKPLRVLSGLNSKKIDVLHAMRMAVEPQISEFRASTVSQSGILVLRDQHVDHAYPDTFSALVDRFVAASGLEKADDIPLSDKCGDVGKALAAPWLERWIEFHRQNAKLRLVLSEDNVRWGNRNPESVA